MNDSRPRFGILLTLGLTLLSAALALYGHHIKDPAETAFQEQLELLQNEKFTEAYYAHTSKEFQKLNPLEVFKTFIRSYPQIGKGSSVRIENESRGEDQASLEVELKRENMPPVYFKIDLAKEDDGWKLIGWYEYDAQEKELLKALDAAFNLIRAGKSETAYMDTSATFQQMTGLEGFQDFIANYPIMTDFTSSTLTKVEEEGGLTILHVDLLNGVQKAAFLFTMEKAGTDWKIRGIRVQSEDILPGVAEPFREETLWKVVEGQLSALKKGKIENSYQEYTSTGFQKDTPLDSFTAFIDKHPIFTQYKKASFAALTFNNNIGILTALIEPQQGPAQKAEFSLIRENGDWKVLQIQLYEPHRP